MVIIFFFLQALVFLISLFLCNIILKLIEKKLSKAQYGFTAKSRYFFSYFIMLIVGITVGKIIIGKLI
ncbi:hypothetical protein Ctaglu_17050 [Clostridium tagluense]|uniref:Uncharacterized protein n=1 Tax=Clostridium tagluense TaxID=360422 RepID=A0A401UKT3_9CLOT|nr:hypothetical protein Ctaglu_17050 [Clostridium tagluense]